MTVPIMYRLLALILVAVLAAAGILLARSRSGDQADEPALAEAAAVASLEVRVAELEDQVGSSERSDERLSEQVASLRQRLERRVTDLQASLKDLRGAVREARSGASAAAERAEDASSRADRALARVEALARDLTVLEDRFNVHMRRHHGGG